MTSLAFILGMLPLVFSSGAEGVSRRTLGATIPGEMLATTLLNVLITPIFWVAVEGHTEKRLNKKEKEEKQKAGGDEPGQGENNKPKPRPVLICSPSTNSTIFFCRQLPCDRPRLI